MSLSGIWHVEKVADDKVELLKVSSVIYVGRTKYQSVKVVENPSLGKCLIIDDYIQSSTYDEHIYHETLVHPAFSTHGFPRRVVVIGGGEGATAREALRWKNVESVVMFEIDSEVVEICKTYLSEINRGVFDDPRFKLVIEEGREALSKLDNNSIDALVVDVTDPISGGPSYLLYTREFYQLAKKKLKTNGVLATQSTSPIHNSKVYSSIKKTLATVFKHVSPLFLYIPSFSTLWSVTVASDVKSMYELDSKTIERAFRENGVEGLRFYNPSLHEALVTISKAYGSNVDAEGVVITDNNPITL